MLGCATHLTNPGYVDYGHNSVGHKDLRMMVAQSHSPTLLKLEIVGAK